MAAPVLFVSHGSPDLALAHGHPWAQALRGYPLDARAVLVVSAHWWTEGLQVTSAQVPGVLHDFAGFSRALQALDYPAPGSPALALRLETLLGPALGRDPERPLDHGAWAVLRHIRPEADLPVVQLSLPRWEPAHLLRLGRELAPLLDDGVALLASGGLVHNLGRLAWGEPGEAPEPWAREAEAWVLDRVWARDLEALADHRRRWPLGREAAPTTEHLDPLFVALGAAGDRPCREVHRGFQLGSLSLACLAWEEEPA